MMIRHRLCSAWAAIGLLNALCFICGVGSAAAPPDELAAGHLPAQRSVHADPVHVGAATRALTDGLRTAAPFGGPIPGVDTLANFTGQYTAKGVDWNGAPQSQWSYAMVGRSPSRGGETTLRAPLIAVSVDLLDAAGQPRYRNGHRLYSDGTRNIKAALQSPIYTPAKFPGNREPLQFADAVQRAEFNAVKGEEWHTRLAPVVGQPLVMSVPQDPACGTTAADGTPGHCNYHYALNADGTCCLYILMDSSVFGSNLFPPSYPVDNTTIIGAAESSGDMRTTDVTSFLFPDTYLYVGDTSNCCILGYHSFDAEPGATPAAAPRFYVMAYASWVTPGLFGPGNADVTALSHELSELFNDPFVVYDGVTNATPWWLAPNGNCQNNLEVGDAVEGLPNATYPVTLRGVTYHPQNEALLQWFEFQSPSTAYGSAYSYPDPAALPALSAPQGAGCTGPAP
jgi:hypothetical protein